jgi:hypothetical protein
LWHGQARQAALRDIVNAGNQPKTDRMMQMTKLDIAALKKAYDADSPPEALLRLQQRLDLERDKLVVIRLVGIAACRR